MSWILTLSWCTLLCVLVIQSAMLAGAPAPGRFNLARQDFGEGPDQSWIPSGGDDALRRQPLHIYRAAMGQQPIPSLQLVTETRTETIVIRTRQQPGENSLMTDGAESREEGVTLRRKLLRQNLKVATWNVRTLLQPGKLKELCDEATLYQLDLVGVQEVRWQGKGKMMSTSGHTFIHSGKEVDSHTSGVGLLLTPLASRALLSYECHSDRLLSARFDCGIINMTVIVCYAPTEVSDADSKDQFYRAADEFLQKTNKHDIRLVLGDYNARVGNVRLGYESVLGPHAVAEAANDNGSRLLNLAISNNLVIGGSLFPHKDIHKYTWTSQAGSKPRAQIDHILISKWWRRSLLDCRTYRGADIGSDHELVIARVRLKLARRKRATITKKLDLEALGDVRCSNTYRERVTEHLNNHDMADESVEDSWKAWRDAVTSAAEETIPTMNRKRKTWISKRTEDLAKERKRAKRTRDLLGRECHRARYRNLDRQVKASARQDKQDWVDGIADKMEEASEQGHSRELFQLVKRLTGKSTAPPPPIKNKDGEVLTDSDEIKGRWGAYFGELLNRPPPERRLHRIGTVGDALDLNMEAPSMAEVEKAIRKLKNHKAPGPDGIAAELIKQGPKELVEELHRIIVKIWHAESVPDDWRKSLICTIYKKGDKSDCSNYRGISLLSIPGKVFGHIMLDRMRAAVEGKLRENQGGFRSGRGCTDQIFCLRVLMEKVIEFQLPTLAIFVDFKAAFDSVHRPSMWHILSDYGIPAKYVRLIQCVYKDSEAAVLVDGERTDWFRVETGVRQGCIWSPLLFGVLIDFVLRKACDANQTGIPLKKRMRTLFGIEPAEYLADLDYADDVTLVVTDNPRGDRALHSLSMAGGEVGLPISKPKTKGMGIGDTMADIHLDGEQVDTVDHFKYLGSEMEPGGRLDMELRSRMGKASSAFGQLAKLWKSRVSLKCKLRIYNAVVISTLLYSAETWATTQTEERKLDAFDQRCLRRILGVRWYQHVRNTDIRRRTNQPAASLLLQVRRLRWYGHVVRMEDSRLPKRMLNWRPEQVGGRRRRGRTRVRWIDAVKRDGAAAGLGDDLPEAAKNRLQWRRSLALLMA